MKKTIFRQWLALKCRKPIVVVIGARRTGKSYTAIQLAKKSIVKGDSVCVLSPTTALARDVFNSTVNSGLKPNCFVDKSNHAITDCKTKAKIKFKAGSDFDLLFPYNEKLPDVLIIDETFSPIRILTQIDYLQNKRNWKYKKIFIAYTPVRFISKKIFKDLYGNKIKVYVWKNNNKLKQDQIFINGNPLQISKVFKIEEKGVLKEPGIKTIPCKSEFTIDNIEVIK